MRSMRQPTYSSVAWVALTAFLTLATLDIAVQRWLPFKRMREADDGIADLRKSDPEVLVLGSSHARTFHALGLELARRSNGSRTLVSVPLENGKLVPYAWVLEHRLAPLIDEKDAAGAQKRGSLRRLFLLTEWWDSCTADAYWNVPSRAWTASDYLADLGSKGANSFNRNYVQSLWLHLFPGSTLVQHRGHRTVLDPAWSRFSDRFSPRPGSSVHSEPQPLVDERTLEWRTMIENGVECICNPAEMAALEQIVDFSLRRRLDTTVVLFPRKPSTLTKKAQETTLSRFHDCVEAVTAPRGVRLLDFTFSSPLGDTDFMADFDHVSAEGNAKFATWALGGPLSFLTTAPVPMAGAEGK
jgi:hypothetical protein